MPMEKAQLKLFLNNIYPLPKTDLDYFVSFWQPVIYKRKTILTVAGETEKYLYFVTVGVQRAFYLAENNKEASIVFTYPPSFSGIADSFLTQTPSLYFLETITASSFLRISYDQLQQLITEIPALQKQKFQPYKTSYLKLPALHLKVHWSGILNCNVFPMRKNLKPSLNEAHIF